MSLMCQLSLHSSLAEGWIMRQLAGSTITLSQVCISKIYQCIEPCKLKAQMCTNALIMVSIMRGDISLISRLLTAILSWKNETRWPLIYLLSSSLSILNRSINEISLISILSDALSSIHNEKVRREMESVAVSLMLSSSIPSTPDQVTVFPYIDLP